MSTVVARRTAAAVLRHGRDRGVGQTVAVQDTDEVVGLWDSGPFAYGAMESSEFALLGNGAGWAVWMNAAGGMELTRLVWHRTGVTTIDITEVEVISGEWDPRRPGRLVAEGDPLVVDTTTRFGYRLGQERPPLADRALVCLTLEIPFQFATSYALVRREVTSHDAPIVD